MDYTRQYFVNPVIHNMTAQFLADPEFPEFVHKRVYFHLG